MSTPALSTTSPRGTCPLIESWTPTTAHSATAGCAAMTASIDPVVSRCPAGLAGVARPRRGAAQVGAGRPAGPGLPPVVDHGAPQLLGGPPVGVRVEPLTCEEQVPQAADVVPGELFRVRVLLADRAER